MRCIKPYIKRRWPVKLWLKLSVCFFVVAILGFNAYINCKIRPTLMQLAEYTARTVTTQVIHEAVGNQQQADAACYATLYTVTETGMKIDVSSANCIRNNLIQAVQERMESLPDQVQYIPFGSLTGNSLLSGYGPCWKMELQPQGYVEAEWAESCESLSINTTRYTAQLEIRVTVNMILDGRTETLTVVDTIPMVSVLLAGETPQIYAAALD